MIKLLLAYGTRPEFIKIKPIIDVFNSNNIEYKTLFTGQHTDLAKKFKPDWKLKIVDKPNRLDSIIRSTMGVFSSPIPADSGITHVLVQGDTTSALAVALSAYHHNIKIIHLEAGLRTYDNNNPYPEEANRRMISQIADINLCPTEYAANNLRNEKTQGKIFVVGNTVIDNLKKYKDKCEYTNTILVTMHRRENHHWLDKWFIEINKIAEEHPEFEFVLPIHPNPNVMKHKRLLTNVLIINPLEYDDMLKLLTRVRLVITDSGGLQEECSYFNKICLTCRIVTERPEAIGQSTIMVENPAELGFIFKSVANKYKIDYICPFGDGNSAQKIFEIIKNEIR